MANVMPPEEFKRQYEIVQYRYQELQEKFPLDEKWKKMGRVINRMKAAKARDKMYAIKCLNSLEKYQCLFRDEQRALIVRAVHLMEKTILHKKLNREY